jgi:spore germination protein GerM
MTRARRVLAAAVAVPVLAGCGLPSHNVTRLSPDSVPFGLMSPAVPTATQQAQGPRTYVYFVSGNRLATVPRHVIGANVPAEAARALIEGPTPNESAEGLSSDVPAQTRLVSLDLTGSVATVDLSSEFGNLGGSDQVLAVAQFVYTLTASPYINSVRFAIDGKRIEVPDASGSLSGTPRTRDDYRSLAPKS